MQRDMRSWLPLLQASLIDASSEEHDGFILGTSQQTISLDFFSARLLVSSKNRLSNTYSMETPQKGTKCVTAIRFSDNSLYHHFPFFPKTCEPKQTQFFFSPSMPASTFEGPQYSGCKAIT